MDNCIAKVQNIIETKGVISAERMRLLLCINCRILFNGMFDSNVFPGDWTLDKARERYPCLKIPLEQKMVRKKVRKLVI